MINFWVMWALLIALNFLVFMCFIISLIQILFVNKDVNQIYSSKDEINLFYGEGIY